MTNVLHINSSFHSGGAAVAAQRLHNGLVRKGHRSRFLVGEPRLPTSTVASISLNPQLHEKLISRILIRLGLGALSGLRSFSIPSHAWYKQADIINLHNIHGGYFNYLALNKITKTKPAVWTLHDMWPLTGHCSYSFDCARWESGCGRCPYPNTYPAISHDTTSLEIKLKRAVYSSSNIHIVAISSWMHSLLGRSILSKAPLYMIPNGIDTDSYVPLSKGHCRQLLGIPISSYVLMFASVDLLDQRKGYDRILPAIHSLPEEIKAKIFILTLGSTQENTASFTAPFPSLGLGFVDNDRLKSIAFSAADVFVFPSKADNLPLVLQESMSCGTPMIAYDVGGVSDIVRDGRTGLLANPGDCSSLTLALESLLVNESLRLQMSNNCRSVAIDEFSLDLQADRYSALYSDILAP